VPRKPYSSYFYNLQFGKVFLLSVAALMLTACFPGVYKLDIPQGNILEKDKMEQIKEGMSKRQVRYVLGTPLLMDTFNQDRWDYHYSHRYYLPGSREATVRQAHLILFFEKGQLVKIDKVMPEDFFPPEKSGSAVTPESTMPSPLVPEPDLPEELPQ
jgi:outer membrane protein assembly factor BamE